MAASHFLKMPVLFALGIFLVVSCVCSLSENDFLLAACMTALYFLVSSLSASEFPRRVTEIIALCTVYICAAVNHFFPSPRITDASALLFLSFACYDAVKLRCRGFSCVVRVSLVPWVLAFDVYAAAKVIVRQPVLMPYDLLLYASLACAVVCVSGLPLFLERRYQKGEKELIAFFTGDTSLTAEKIISADSVPGSAVRVLLEKIVASVEQIQSTVIQMQNGKTDIPADSHFILGKVSEIKACIGKEIGRMLSSPEVQSSVAVQMQKAAGRVSGESRILPGKVCVFEDRSPSVSVAGQLSAAGVDCVLVCQEGELFRLLDKKEIRLLIVEPSVTGDRLFDLCRRIRSTENMLSFPILMVVSYFENDIMRRAYETEVNDFIIRPFDVSELVLRVSFLLQLNALYREKETIALSEKEKRAFLYFVTHNVNTPLALLENRVDELVQNYETHLPVEKLVLDDIQESVGEIHGTIQNVLISFRISDGRYINSIQKVDIGEVFDLLRVPAETKAGLKHQRMTWSCGEDLPSVLCDDSALRGILTNLIDNAVKFSPIETGVITVRAHRDGESRVTISVTDNGPGIPQEKRGVLFNRFSDRGTVSTGGEKSTGLGLYVVHELAQMNNIAISYSDAPGGGACFTLSFFKK